MGTKILFIEDAAAAQGVRNGNNDIGASSALDYDLVIYRQHLDGKTGYEVLKCRFEHPEAFVMALVADTGSVVEGEAPSKMVSEPATVTQSKTLVHLDTPNMTLAVKETRAEIVEALRTNGTIELTAFITTQPAQPPTPENPEGVQPQGVWEEITVASHHVSHLTNFRL